MDSKAAPSRLRVASPVAGVRLEVQALRAAAVAAVVVYHLWPHLVPGGFVGVDMFFVISGFLITAHLMREVDRTGRVSLARFWARRARRLLPASLLVLAFSAAGTLVFVPQVYWQQFFKEIAASALYVQNWVLASDSVDYLAAENVASPAQHFWSLSVEEQFYLVWPLLILAAVLLARRFGSSGRRRAVLVALCLVAAGSLALSVSLTQSSAGEAYFVTPTRAWEFAAGGILALVGAAAASKLTGLRTFVAWAGWIAIVVTMFVFSSATPFPGSAALLPVMATVAVIWAGAPESRWSPNRVVTAAPVVFIGNISYSVYLWHWPLIVFAAFSLGDDFRWWMKFGLVAVALVLAWGTTRWVENPVRDSLFLARRRSRWTLLAALVAMAMVIGPVVGSWYSLVQEGRAELARSAQLLADATPCFGAAASYGASLQDDARGCDTTATAVLTPNPAAAIDDKPEIYSNGCYAHLDDPLVRSCTTGSEGTNPRVALIGDSHAASWYPAVKTIAEQQGWELSTFMKSACPHSTALKSNDVLEAFESCRDWNRAMVTTIAGIAPFDVILVSHSTTSTAYESDEAEIEGFRAAWRSFTDRGAEVIVIRDIPRVPEDTNRCLSENVDNLAICDQPASEAIQQVDLMVRAADDIPAASVVDMTPYLCSEDVCPAVIGDVVVYRDSHHLTATYSQTLAPYLLAEIRESGVPAVQ